MKSLKKTLGYFFLIFGSFLWIITVIGILVEGYITLLKNIDVALYPVIGYVIFFMVCIPMIVGSILLIDKD